MNPFDLRRTLWGYIPLWLGLATPPPAGRPRADRNKRRKADRAASAARKRNRVH